MLNGTWWNRSSRPPNPAADTAPVQRDWISRAGNVQRVAGANLVHLALLGMAALVAALPLALSVGYRQSRWEAFVDPWRDPRGIGFHIIQSLIAMGTGGISGRGLGSSLQKFYYVPGSHTDAIFAITGWHTNFDVATVYGMRRA